MISLYGTGITNFLAGTFDGLHNVKQCENVLDYSMTLPPCSSLTSLGLKSRRFLTALLVLGLQMLGTVGLEKLESIEMAYFHENRCDGGAPHYGPSFDNFAEVSDILTGINPLVTFTMEAMEEMQDSTMRALVQQIPIAVRIIVMEPARTSRPPFPILQGKSEFLKLCFRGIWVVFIWFCGCFFFVLD